MQARATIDGFDAGELVKLWECDERGADYGSTGSILYRKVENDLNFELYIWWDYSVEDMLKTAIDNENYRKELFVVQDASTPETVGDGLQDLDFDDVNIIRTEDATE